MKKNTVLIINPVSVNIMKAIYNALVINMLDIIILGDRKIIYALCMELNLDIGQLQIIDLLQLDDISVKVDEYTRMKEIKGIIIDDNISGKLIKKINTRHICSIIDYGIFLKSIFIIKYKNTNELMKNINETIEILNNLNQNNINIGLIGSKKETICKIKKEIKEKIKIKKVDLININKISKIKYNIIIFEDKIEEMVYTNSIINKALVRTVEIRKASNMFIFDAKGKSLKNVFIQLLFISKIDKLSNEVNSKVI